MGGESRPFLRRAFLGGAASYQEREVERLQQSGVRKSNPGVCGRSEVMQAWPLR